MNTWFCIGFSSSSSVHVWQHRGNVATQNTKSSTKLRMPVFSGIIHAAESRLNKVGYYVVDAGVHHLINCPNVWDPYSLHACQTRYLALLVHLLRSTIHILKLEYGPTGKGAVACHVKCPYFWTEFKRKISFHNFVRIAGPGRSPWGS